MSSQFAWGNRPRSLGFRAQKIHLQAKIANTFDLDLDLGASILIAHHQTIWPGFLIKFVRFGRFNLLLAHSELGFVISDPFLTGVWGFSAQNIFWEPILTIFRLFSNFWPSKSSVFLVYSHSRGVSHHFPPPLSSLLIEMKQRPRKGLRTTTERSPPWKITLPLLTNRISKTFPWIVRFCCRTK